MPDMILHKKPGGISLTYVLKSHSVFPVITKESSVEMSIHLTSFKIVGGGGFLLRKHAVLISHELLV